MEEATVTRELPRYKSHKTVYALKIKAAENDGNPGMVLTPEDRENYAPFRVDQKFLDRNDLTPGGYYVVYEDGYKSFSPAKAFEEGYTRL
jgi:hypothetical protein